MLYQSYIRAGYSGDQASQLASKVVWYSTPEYPYDGELREAGAIGYDIFSKNSSGIKKIKGVYQEEDKSSGKGEKANQLLRDFENLDEGTYKWNGSEWVKQ